MDVFEAMETCVAMRYLRPDPVPEALVRRVVYAATRASNPGNSQGWDFVVLRDAAAKARLAGALREAFLPTLSAMADAEQDAMARRMYAGVRYLVDHFEQVPLYVLVCGRVVYPPQQPLPEMVPAALYPAAQNLIVAARALGLGTTFTVFQNMIEAAFREELAIPDDVRLGVTIAMGWPARPFSPVRRKPLDEVLHWDRW